MRSKLTTIILIGMVLGILVGYGRLLSGSRGLLFSGGGGAKLDRRH
jgi:hypothetical protein